MRRIVTKPKDEIYFVATQYKTTLRTALDRRVDKRFFVSHFYVRLFQTTFCTYVPLTLKKLITMKNVKKIVYNCYSHLCNMFTVSCIYGFSIFDSVKLSLRSVISNRSTKFFLQNSTENFEIRAN